MSCLDKIGDSKYVCAFRILAFAGLRRGELVALKWKDIDFEKARLSVHRAFYYNDNIMEGTPIYSHLRSR